MTTLTLDLYGLTDEYVALADSSIEAEGEDFTAMLDALAEIAAEEKVLRLAKVVGHLSDEAAILDERARQIQLRAQSRRNRVDHLKRFMTMLMEGHHIDKTKDPFVTVWLQGSPPSVNVVDEALVPAMYKRATVVMPLDELPKELREIATVQVMKAQIMADCKEDGEVPAGVEVITGQRHLRIK